MDIQLPAMSGTVNINHTEPAQFCVFREIVMGRPPGAAFVPRGALLSSVCIDFVPPASCTASSTTIDYTKMLPDEYDGLSRRASSQSVAVAGLKRYGLARLLTR